MIPKLLTIASFNCVRYYTIWPESGWVVGCNFSGTFWENHVTLEVISLLLQICCRIKTGSNNLSYRLIRSIYYLYFDHIVLPLSVEDVEKGLNSCEKCALKDIALGLN